MKKYILEAVINNESIVLNDTYHSTTDALNAGFKYLEKEHIYDVHVEEEFKNEATDNVEYILSNHDRLIVCHA